MFESQCAFLSLYSSIYSMTKFTIKHAKRKVRICELRSDARMPYSMPLAHYSNLRMCSTSSNRIFGEMCVFEKNKICILFDYINVYVFVFRNETGSLDAAHLMHDTK